MDALEKLSTNMDVDVLPAEKVPHIKYLSPNLGNEVPYSRYPQGGEIEAVSIQAKNFRITEGISKK